jgi:non-ribosomal peptide synthetase component E (peptide arylation enzyme)
VDILDTTTSAYPEATAIKIGKEQLNYAKLAQEVIAKAKQVKDIGVGIGDRVGIRMSSISIELYIAICVMLAAGAAYVLGEYVTLCLFS